MGQAAADLTVWELGAGLVIREEWLGEVLKNEWWRSGVGGDETGSSICSRHMLVLSVITWRALSSGKARSHAQ